MAEVTNGISWSPRINHSENLDLKVFDEQSDLGSNKAFKNNDSSAGNVQVNTNKSAAEKFSDSNVKPKALDNNSFVRQTVTEPVKPNDSGKVNSAVVNNAAQQYTTEVNKQQQAPGITLPSVVANTDMLEKQIAVSISTFSNLPPAQIHSISEQTAKELVSLADKGSFSITDLANGFTGKTAAIMQLIVETQLKNKESLAQQSSTMAIVSRTMGESAAAHTIKAGEDNRNMVNTQAAVGITMSIGAGAIQTKGLNNSNKAIDYHGTKSNNLMRQSDSLHSKAAGGNKLDTSLLRSTSKDLKHDSAMQNQLQQLRTNDASKLQMQGMMLGQSSHSVGGLASSQGHVDKAENEAQSQMDKTDQGVYLSTKEAIDRSKQSEAELQVLLMQLISNLLSQRANSNSAIISNIKA